MIRKHWQSQWHTGVSDSAVHSSDENLVQRWCGTVDDFAVELRDLSFNAGALAVTENRPFPALAVASQSTVELQRLIKRLFETHGESMMRGQHVVHRRSQQHFSQMQHRDVVGHSLHFVEQVR